MISLSGASLIATIFPIGLLVLAVEARRVRPSTARYRVGKWLNIVASVVTFVTVFLALTSVGICVISVSSDVQMPAVVATYVNVAGWLLSLNVAYVFFELLGERNGANDALNRLGDAIEQRVKLRQHKKNSRKTPKA